jgi:hypothetical protein
MLDLLEPLVGAWTIEVQFPGREPVSAEGARLTFEWILDRHFLLQRSTVPDTAVPDGLCVIALDEERDSFTQHYFDARGVVRVYGMNLEGGVLTLWRNTPDFSALDFAQRFRGEFSADGTTITGAWEIAHDGKTFEHDFAMSYRRIT